MQIYQILAILLDQEGMIAAPKTNNMTRSFIALIAISLISYNANGQRLTKPSSVWPVVEKEMKPWTRWWWMGNAVDEHNLNKFLSKYHKFGFGGVEITPIYGAKGFENRYIDFLSSKWIDLLTYTVKRSSELDMGVDMNTGTGWPFGGPLVTPENAATKLIVQHYEVKPGQRLNEVIKIKDNKQAAAMLQALTAYGSNGEVLDLLAKVGDDGTLNWTFGNGDWHVYAAFAGKTLQEVKRAAPGGKGFTLDHLDKTSVTNYLHRFDEAFTGKPPGVRSFFNDSYEVFGANWTPSLLDEFKKRRGYDLKYHLKQLISKDSTGEEIARVKSDYRETMSDLILHNFTKNWSDWAHRYGAMTKNQSHGSPGNLLDLYGAVDIPETETFGSASFSIPGLRRDSNDARNVEPDVIMSKFASSAAHTGGKNLVSSETFTWLTEHFKTSYSQCKPQVEQLFLSGVNHVFYHGTTYSPEDVGWPGWLFYASAEFTPANSLWPHISGLNSYITRCQSILQSGKADNEVLIYWPVYDVWNKAKGMDFSLGVHNIDEWLKPTEFYKISEKLVKAGFSVDFASDRVLKQSMAYNEFIKTSSNESPYKVLIIPKCEVIDINTLEKVMQLAKDGATVIFQELPKDVPGLGQLDQRRKQFRSVLDLLDFSDMGDGVRQFKTGKGIILLANDVEDALAFTRVNREQLTDSGLQFIRRRFDGGKYYYLVNHTSKDIDEEMLFNQTGTVLFMDPQTGYSGIASANRSGNRAKVRIQLRSGESMVLKISDSLQSGPPWTYLNKPGNALVLTAPWELTFTAGGPELPSSQRLDHLVNWTSLPDRKFQSFSGTGVYSSTFNIINKTAKEYLLQLNQVNESARVWINGKDVGIVWSIPFQARIGRYLKTGSNTIKIEVVNLMANRIRYMDERKIPWKNYHEINFVNINYKPFDASNWMIMPSGLTGPVRIVPYF